MTELVANCPRCRAKQITFDLLAAQPQPLGAFGISQRFEAYCICRECRKSTVFVLGPALGRTLDSQLLKSAGSISKFVLVESFISLKDMAAAAPPPHLPENLEAAFREAATCVAVQCPNAAGTMFRLCIDLATHTLLPENDASEPSAAIRRSLGRRLKWLFSNGVLPDDLEDLSVCIREDGNDGAHAGTLTMTDVEDLQDFAFVLLERIYTQPKKVRLARERREQRRQKDDK